MNISLVLELVAPWLDAADTYQLDRTHYGEYAHVLPATVTPKARQRVVRSLVRNDYSWALMKWLDGPAGPWKTKVWQGRVYSSEQGWLLDLARSARAGKCARMLQARGAASGKGSKRRGGRQGRWKSLS